MKTYDEPETASHSDTEITLGMTSILGIFFGLALICGVFFGFGYSMGRTNTHRAPTAAQASSPESAATPYPVKTVVEPADGQAKPAAGAPMAAPVLAASDSAAPAAPGQVANASYTAAAAGNPTTATNPPQSSAAAPAAAIMVQIAAVSRPEDANVLVSALRNLGYNASVHSETSDQLLHVQLGPFATRQEALAIRAKLINDGYNAILK